MFRVPEIRWQLLLALLLMMACGEDVPLAPVDPPVVQTSYQVVEAFPALGFIKPIDLRDPGDGTHRLVVADQLGLVHVFENRPDVEEASIFLDLRPQVGAGLFDNGEKGLLSIAFDPDYATNGYFYAYFTSETKMLAGGHEFESRISRFTVNPPTANSVDPATEVAILNIAQPKDWHNGGQLQFDAEGYLYLGVGDGGEPRLAQNPSNLLGSIIRIDVRTLPYSIPEGNAFSGSEIFAYGFRNPWRMSIDSVSGRVIVGDVGSNRFEEVNVVESGNNYGWWCEEGDWQWQYHACATGVEFTAPTWYYSHDVGTAIIGGYVVRGTALPQLDGRYVFSDFTARELWALDLEEATANLEVVVRDTGINISAFGMDVQGQLYMLEWNFLDRLDKIYKVIAVEEPSS